MARQQPPVLCVNCGSRTGLYDRGRLMRELGITKAAAEGIMRQLPKIRPPQMRKVYVRGEDVETFLASSETPP